MKRVGLNSIRPAAMFAVPAANQLQFLSDDNGVVTEGVACTDRDAAHRSFRSITVKKPEPARSTCGYSGKWQDLTLATSGLPRRLGRFALVTESALQNPPQPA